MGGFDLPQSDTTRDRSYAFVAGMILCATAGIMAALLYRLMGL